MWLLLALACTPEAPPDPCTTGPPPELEIGTGEYAYEPHADGGVLELIHGPQGGFHVLIGLSARYLDIADVVVGELSGSVGGEELARAVPYLQLRCNGVEGAAQSWGTLLIWDSTPEELHGQLAQIDAHLVDAQGNEATAQTTAMLWCPSLEEE